MQIRRLEIVGGKYTTPETKHGQNQDSGHNNKCELSIEQIYICDCTKINELLTSVRPCGGPNTQLSPTYTKYGALFRSWSSSVSNAVGCEKKLRGCNVGFASRGSQTAPSTCKACISVSVSVSEFVEAIARTGTE